MATDTPAGPGPAGAQFEWKGKTYHVRRVTQQVQDDFEVWCNAQALARVRKLAAVQSPQEYAEDYDAALRRVMCGALGWDMPDGQAFRFTPDGMVYLCWLCMKGKANPKLTHDDVKLIARDGAGASALFGAYREANADPLAVPPPVGPMAGGDSAGGSSSSGGEVSDKSAAWPMPTSGAST